MGVVNTTPDSFSDGGRYAAADAAIAHGLALMGAGADILDVGGEATNPRAVPVDAATELARVLAVIAALVAAGARVSIDTTKAAVARAAIAAGASIVNDISGGLFDADMAAVLAASDAAYIAGHVRGRTLADVFGAEGAPPTWQEVASELAARVAALPPAVRARTWVDPGIGFGKGSDPAGNLSLIAHAGDLARITGRPVAIGASRKRFLCVLLEAAAIRPTEAALDDATVGASLAAVHAGATMLRVHDVARMRAALVSFTNG